MPSEESQFSMNPLQYVEGRSTALDSPDFVANTNLSTVDGGDLSVLSDLLHRHLPHIARERMFDLGQVDKIFASTWLTEEMALVGTKNNKLIVVEIATGKLFDIPTLRNSRTIVPQQTTGIHCIETSPAKRFLATGGNSPNDLALYQLPGLTPYRVGQGHDDWLFDVVWLSEEVLITGSRDSTMAAWTVRDDPIDINSSPVLAENVPCLTPTHHFYNRPLLDVPRSTGDRVRSLAYNRNTGMLASLQASLCDASVFFWDPYTITELCAMELPYCAENVCMEVAPDFNLFAVGSRSHISFIDGRMANRAIGSIRSWNKDCGIRSLQFKQELISVGTGAGNIVFYDLRAARFLSMIDESELTDIRRENVCCRYASNGWLRRDATYRDYFSGSPPPPSALYTHKYSPSHSRLLLAGGPLPLGLYGNYCAVWS